jgi:hypothetical protein
MANDEFDSAQSQTVDKFELTIHREPVAYQVVVKTCRRASEATAACAQSGPWWMRHTQAAPLRTELWNRQWTLRENQYAAICVTWAWWKETLSSFVLG